MKKCLLYLKKKSFFNLEDIYNIIQVLQYKRNLAIQILLLPSTTRHMSRSREDFYIWLYAGLQDTMLAVLSRVLSWYVSQSYLLLDVFFFLSLKKNPYFYSQLIVVTCRLSFSASTDHIFKHSVHCFLPSLIFHNVIFYVRVVKFTQFLFFHAGLFCIYLLSWDTASSI